MASLEYGPLSPEKDTNTMPHAVLQTHPHSHPWTWPVLYFFFFFFPKASTLMIAKPQIFQARF